ncbi:unnamed protein product [Amoebophrya sp. A120]|nr:unnamed protein product [Amoebophrya sp. A120]|eukprot:GSA120T00022898001.1
MRGGGPRAVRNDVRNIILFFITFYPQPDLFSSTSFAAAGSAALSLLKSITKPEDDCECRRKDPLTNRDVCFQPVCPKGYFRCCHECEWASCFTRSFSTRENNRTLQLSLRGEFECLPCERGDYCAGCDDFHECPKTQRLSYAERKVVDTPKISLPRASHERECLTCPSEGEADYTNDRCLPSPWRHACDEKELEHCLLDCKRGADACDQLKCRMACAKEQSEACVAAFKEMCEEMVKRPLDFFGVPIHPTDYTNERTHGNFFADAAMATIEPVRLHKVCDANCSAAWSFKRGGGGSGLSFMMRGYLGIFMAVLVFLNMTY